MSTAGGGPMTVTARPLTPTPSDALTRARRTLEGVIGVPATEGNHIVALRNGDEIFPSMLEAIERAEHTVDFLTFVYWRGEIGTRFAGALGRRARAGVRVRVLLDAWGSYPIDPAIIEDLRRNGVRIRWFRPLRRFHPGEVNHRTHRKVMIVDESVGFTGGVGISDLWKGDARNPDEWRDTHFRIMGPAVDGLRAAFLDNWAETDPVLFEDAFDRFPDQPKPGDSVVQCVRGAAETGWSDVATLFRTLLQLAQREVRIVTAYFVPDPELTDRLMAAADRGVRVQVLLPGPHADKRFVQVAGEAAYGELLAHGVEIWNFQPTMLHAKLMTVDGILANVGSANLNGRSVNLDEEINLVAMDPKLVGILNGHFDEDLDRSVRIAPGRWERRSLRQQIAERLVAPFRHLT
ncbi:MAG TPA: phospholipase D-like domain-containing protein [Acidimicrobiales bacterium]|nr:phospholipase D-like domain-containing protein [Acidimicrobiales bacterium]